MDLFHRAQEPEERELQWIKPFDSRMAEITRLQQKSETCPKEMKKVFLSAWGEPLYHPDFLKIVEKILSYEGLSVFFETDGLSVTSDLCQKLAELEKAAKPRTNGWNKIMIAISLDAVKKKKKYDDFAGLLPPCKPADLSPLERDPCWHLRRDLTILSNGEVPSCRACVLSGSLGNVFTENLEDIWHKSDDLLKNHIDKKYCEKCEKCDEWYTFNF